MKTPFKMKGFSGFGNSPMEKRFEDDSIINSAPREYEAHNGVKGVEDTNLKDGRAASSAFQYKSPNKFDMASMGSMTGGEGGGGNGGGLTDALGSLTGGGKSDKKGGEQKREVPRPYFY